MLSTMKVRGSNLIGVAFFSVYEKGREKCSFDAEYNVLYIFEILY